jgi:O-antigen ligase
LEKAMSKSQQKLSSQRPEFLLMLLLLFWIPMESTLLGRVYTHVLGLNSKVAGNVLLKMEAVIVSLQSFLLLTIVLPIAIIILSKAAPRKHQAPFAIRLGLSIWLLGASISSLAHFNDGLVILNFAAGLFSGALVYYAVGRVRLESPGQFEYAFRAIGLGALIPCTYDLLRYYKAWGIPSIQGMIEHKYVVSYWSNNSYFGNPDNSSGMYSFFASMCMVVLFAKMFTPATRWLAAMTLVVTSVFTFVTMARTGITFYVVAFLLTAILLRGNKRIWLVATAITALVIFASPSRLATFWRYIDPALTYNSSDRSVSGRIESMREGWNEFLDHPVIGLGPNRSFLVIDEFVAHELPIAQADETGIFGFLGVIIVTFACALRLTALIRRGSKEPADMIEFLFLIGPSLYFVRGAVSGVVLNNTVVNTFICMTFACLAIVDRRPLTEYTPVRFILRPSTHQVKATVR